MEADWFVLGGLKLEGMRKAAAEEMGFWEPAAGVGGGCGRSSWFMALGTPKEE